MIVKRRDTHYYNIFAGLLYCGYCGAPMQRKYDKKGHSKGQIACSDRLAGLTKCPSSAVKHCDPTILENIYLVSSASLGTDTGQRLSNELAVVEEKLRDKAAQGERIADAIAQAGGSVSSLAAKAKEIDLSIQELADQRDELLQAQAVSMDYATFDSSWLDNALTHLYASNAKSRDVRVALHLQIARLVETIWIWGYEVAIIRYKNIADEHVVPLPHKQLPSRANPTAKHHKPPKPKEPPKRPNLEVALKGELFPPDAKKRWSKSVPKKPYLLQIEEEVKKETVLETKI